MGIYKTQLENRIFEIIKPSLAFLGYEVIRVKMIKKGRPTLQILIERDNIPISLEDCEAASRQISVLLDVEDVIHQRYTLEVGSAGLDRPLTRFEDFNKNISSVAKVTLYNTQEGKKKFFGIIQSIAGEEINFALLENPELFINVNYNNVMDAHLDYDKSCMIKKDALNNKKQGRKKNG